MMVLDQTNWSESDEQIVLFRVSPKCTVLGPGRRAVLWVQGCPFRCRGCVVPESLPFEGGVSVAVDELAGRLLALPDLDGVTFSGGEPMAQAGALSRLADLLRAGRDLSLMSYSGYTYEHLRDRGTAAQRGLLGKLDLLVDGQYVQARHTDLRWRGSDNQRVVFLSDRHRDQAARLDDRGTWVEFEVTTDGVAWMGIPPPGFRGRFETLMQARGVILGAEGGADHERTEAQ